MLGIYFTMHCSSMADSSKLFSKVESKSPLRFVPVSIPIQQLLAIVSSLLLELSEKREKFLGVCEWGRGSLINSEGEMEGMPERCSKSE